MSTLWDFSSVAMDFSKAAYFFDGNIGSGLLSDSPALAAYDDAAGTITLRWSSFAPLVPDSYNVYLDGVLNSNVTTVMATLAGLAAGSTHEVVVTAVQGGIEVSASLHAIVTVRPTSTSTVTLMRRPFPFPSTGMN